jgi:pyruvate/2-oxoglutarate dehydrogenase complex dihydrolipoamide dehydrogenase (E3) component
VQADVIVIGSGQAGVPLAARLAQGGRRVLLAERARLGGTCVNVGCTPTKTMVASARAAHVARTAARLGVHVDGVRVDLSAIVDRKDRIVDRWRDGVAARLRRAGVSVLDGHACFVGPREVEVDGQRHTAPLVIVNTGARPAAPPVPGLDQVKWLTSTSVMALRQPPRRLLVMGGGYIGCEFAQMFRRFGCAVTVADVLPHLMGPEDEDTSAALEDVFRREGIALELGAKVERVSAADGGVALHVEGRPALEGSHLLVATGRRPNTDDLGCEAAGIRLDARGFIEVDDHYRTSAEGVYAVGDVTPGPQFTHASWDDHRRLHDHLSGRPSRPRSERLVPMTVFTDPQVARVGLTEKEARKRGLAFEMATMPFGDVARAIELDETAGTMKVLVDPGTERVLGASIVGSEAGELIHVFVALMQAGAPARALVEAECVHPTFAEGLQTLVMKLRRFALD